MKKLFLFLGITAMVLLSCEGNNAGNLTSHGAAEDESGSGSEEAKKDLFDREIFDRERQLWLKQDIQNYSFYQDCTFSNGSGAEATVQYIKNGETKYFRRLEWYNDYTEVTETHEDGSTSGYGYGTGRGYRPGKDLYTTEGRRDILFAPASEMHKWLSISITSLYAQIDDLAKEGKQIYIRYDNNFHYPSHLTTEKAPSFSLDISKLVVNPEIGDESNAKGQYE
ncbi:MAG: hypothetical protein LBU28_09825 [Spirochaetaceae bacterium]|nr:hypothetical protein [Spirochaetaceae bacterium]